MALPMPKPSPKPAIVPKPGLFAGGKPAPVKQLIQQAQKDPIMIPGTGGQLMPKKQFANLLKQRLSYDKVNTHLTEYEARNVLRQMRHEDKGNPSRERRILEERWGLKGKY